MTAAGTPAQFIAKWSRVELSERAASQEHFIDLCRLLGQPTPAEHDATGAEYTFEKGVKLGGAGILPAGGARGAARGASGDGGSPAEGDGGFADVWWRGKFGWEYKRKGKYKDLAQAYGQLCRYREALENPPLLIVSDIARTEIHTNFTGTRKDVHTIPLEQLDQPEKLDLIRRAFTDPDSFKPQKSEPATSTPRTRSSGAIKSNPMMNKPHVIDLFCGAGGMALGFVRAGFEVVAAFDNWDAAVKTYRNNLGDHVRLASINDDLNLPAATVIIGGPPCQGFSSAGSRREDDHRNTLVAVFARLIAKRRPRAFVFENVEGFLTGGTGRFVFDLLDPLIEAGYRVHLRKVNAANYGVPQHRKRVIGIGGLGWDPTFPTPTHTAHGAPGALLAGTHLPLTPTVSEAFVGLEKATVGTNGDDHTYSPLDELDRERAARLRPGQRMRDLPEELWHESYKRRAHRRVMDGMPVEKRGGAPAGLRRLCATEPSKAITGAAINELIHPAEDRPLTVRECARIQTFPDDFFFSGSRRDQAQQIGNGVPPRLAEAIGKTLLRDLQSAPDGVKPGALLSFTPTLSTGMSPILDCVKRKVERAYGGAAEQGMLWP